ncbi:hypothetical protein EYF80_048528 [Liparis tanakae]|uniref:Uncharacterized protein n=1 Tax=Liparis tanakae TaxID=230148 RepID=A0A4Z2FJC7_9TELE|nr:hypothetical protein EYF80_048528 [Liparis tanakae]
MATVIRAKAANAPMVVSSTWMPRSHHTIAGRGRKLRSGEERGRHEHPEESGRREHPEERGRREHPEEGGRREHPEERGRHEHPEGPELQSLTCGPGWIGEEDRVGRVGAGLRYRGSAHYTAPARRHRHDTLKNKSTRKASTATQQGAPSTAHLERPFPFGDGVGPLSKCLQMFTFNGQRTTGRFREF